MKKTLILVVVMMLVASSAFAASIVNSKHDLSSASAATVRSSNVSEICVFCHTPHSASTSITAPLWNRNGNATTWQNTGNYSTSTMNTSSSTPGGAAAISAICLSCHDGNVGDESLVNAPGSGNSLTVTWSASTFTGVANLNDSTGVTNDHPFGISMENSGDTTIYSTPSATALSSRLFGGKVECPTCHLVHDPGIPPFLAMSNTRSAMCLACHNK